MSDCHRLRLRDHSARQFDSLLRRSAPTPGRSHQLYDRDLRGLLGQFACLAGLLLAGWLWRRGRRILAHAAGLVFLSAFSVATLAMPLGATKLYLFGISVDQQFRTEYMTRLADTATLKDMTYFGLPPFYALHAWVWKPNPFETSALDETQGIFNAWNPRVEC